MSAVKLKPHGDVLSVAMCMNLMAASPTPFLLPVPPPSTAPRLPSRKTKKRKEIRLHISRSVKVKSRSTPSKQNVQRSKSFQALEPLFMYTHRRDSTGLNLRKSSSWIKDDAVPLAAVGVNMSKSKRRIEKDFQHTGPTLPLPACTGSNTFKGSQQESTTDTDKTANKKSKHPPLLVAIKPENQESEKERFMKAKFNYDPQFVYRNPPKPAAFKKYTKASDRLLPLAFQIMNNTIRKYGTYEAFEKKTGGKQLTRSQIAEAARMYLEEEGLGDEINVVLSADLVSRACFTRVKGKPTLNIRVHNIRELWMDGLLRHEIGTHYLRSSNNQCQIWGNAKKRKELQLLPLNPTEEGLASLHSVIFRKNPLLWRCALLYYTVYKASQLSFSDLFKDLEKFVYEPEVRWDYCLRAKRGQTDTSLPGAFCKDQVYLEGALQILKHRKDIDFHMLLRLGKVSYQDMAKLTDMATLENTKIPKFMEDLEDYRDQLDIILFRNGLTDKDLQVV